jgi:hypothetical protein
LGGGRFFLLSFLDFSILVVQVWVGGPWRGNWPGFAGDARSWDMDGKGSFVFGNVFIVFFVRISFFGNILTSLYLANNLV